MSENDEGSDSAPVMKMPRQVRIALIILWVSLLVDLGLTALGPHADVLAEVPNWLFAVGLTFGYGVDAMLIVCVSQRRNWARLALLILTILSAAALAYPWSGFDATYRHIFNLCNLLFGVANIVALVLLFVGTGANWFRPNKRGIVIGERM